MTPPVGATTEIAIAVIEHAGQYLIGLRPADAPLPGLWEFPGGKIHAGESPDQAVARECLEETGLAVIVGEPFPDVLYVYDHGQLRLHFFRCHLVDPKSAAVVPARFQWVAGEKLIDYAFPPANAELIRCLVRCSQEMKNGEAKGDDAKAQEAETTEAQRHRDS